MLRVVTACLALALWAGASLRPLDAAQRGPLALLDDFARMLPRGGAVSTAEARRLFRAAQNPVVQAHRADRLTLQDRIRLRYHLRRIGRASPELLIHSLHPDLQSFRPFNVTPPTTPGAYELQRESFVWSARMRTITSPPIPPPIRIRVTESGSMQQVQAARAERLVEEQTLQKVERAWEEVVQRVVPRIHPNASEADVRKAIAREFAREMGGTVEAGADITTSSVILSYRWRNGFKIVASVSLAPAAATLAGTAYVCTEEGLTIFGEECRALAMDVAGSWFEEKYLKPAREAAERRRKASYYPGRQELRLADISYRERLSHRA